MQGLEFTRHFGDNLQRQICQHFGSVEQVYQRVFELQIAEYQLTKEMPDRETRYTFCERMRAKLQTTALFEPFQAIQTQLNNLCSFLEMHDEEILGEEFVLCVGKDFEALILHKQTKTLKTYLKRFGGKFPNLEAWLEELKK